MRRKFVLLISPIAVAAATLLGAAPAAHAAGMTARGSIGEIYVLGAKAKQKVTLLDRSGRTAGTGRADRFGSFIFRDLRQGATYTVRAGSQKKRATVLKAGANPPESFYKKMKLKPGLNYVKMRDGVELAMTLRLPAGKTLADGPFPTV